MEVNNGAGNVDQGISVNKGSFLRQTEHFLRFGNMYVLPLETIGQADTDFKYMAIICELMNADDSGLVG